MNQIKRSVSPFGKVFDLNSLSNGVKNVERNITTVNGVDGGDDSKKRKIRNGEFCPSPEKSNEVRLHQ
jgi:hypothetical protein